MTSIKHQALAHYDRMIAWAEQQPSRKHVSAVEMEEEISDQWKASECSFCRKYKNNRLLGYGHLGCNNCLLYCKIKNRHHCCAGLWDNMNSSRTWKTWLKYARLVRAYIEEHG